MRYYVSLDSRGKTCEVDVVELANGTLEVRADGRPVDVDVTRVGSSQMLRVDGRVVDLVVHGTPPDLEVVTQGYRARVSVESEQSRAGKQAERAGNKRGDRVVKSPMPGRVVRVLVAEGDSVASGQGLLVLEAMKMENEVRAREAGTIAKVHVREGTAVEGNATLVTLA